jgi:hypothetical protein
VGGKRRFFVVAWNDGIDFAMYCDSQPTQTVAEWLELIPQALNAQSGSEEHITTTLRPGDNCLLFDWGVEELPADLRVNQIPKPGVIFAVRTGSHLETTSADSGAAADRREVEQSGDQPTTGEAATGKPGDGEANATGDQDAGGEYTLTYMLKRELWRGDSVYAKRLQSFLDSPEASYDPLPVSLYDAFISYSGADQALASEIVRDLDEKSMRTFLASRDLAAGTLWTNEVRDALLSSRVVVLVLTPNSATRPWVMVEVGAAWALGKPLLPALAYVDPKTLPEVISAFQGRRIETTEGRRSLVTEVVRMAVGGD